MRQVIIGMVGHPASGKSTFAKRLTKELGISHINKDDIRDFLVENIFEYRDADKSYSNEKISSVNRVVKVASDELMEELAARGKSFIIDGYGKIKEQRNEMKKFFKEKNILLPVIIVYVVEEREVILKRLKKRDDNKTTKWVENFLKVWEPGFSEPTKKECDLLIKVTKTNVSESIELIRDFINS